MKLVKGKQAYSFRAINTNHTSTSLIFLFDNKSLFKNISSGIIALVFVGCQANELTLQLLEGLYCLAKVPSKRKILITKH